MKIKKYYSMLCGMMVALGAGVLTSCLKNDIPYPLVQCAFLTIEAEHQLGKAAIDTKNQVVTLNLDETANLADVRITSYTITEEATISSDIRGGINLSGEPYSVVLSLYQDYTWLIRAQQEIERYFTVAGQVGTSIIDVPARRVVAYVPKSADLTAVSVTSMKLGPAEVSTTTPSLEGTTVDFSKAVHVKITYHSTVEDWTIYVERSAQDVQLTQADAWTRVAWLYGWAEAGKKNGFEYRLQGTDSWTAVPERMVTHNGGSFTARLTGLSPETSYEVRAVSGEISSAAMVITTESELTVPNLNFDDWWLDGKIWCPWVEGKDAYWGTGNKGTTTLGNSNSVPGDDTWNGGKGHCAELNTKFVGIGVVGKLAAGNLFTGDYVRTDGTNGILNFGRPFTGRPTRLKGHYKYNCMKISHTSSEFTDYKGRPDTCSIYITLTDWDSPYEIRTNPNNRQLFDVNSPNVIAIGKLEKGVSVSEWTDFDIELEYRATNRRPKYILIVCSASKLGDYFTGGDGSTLWVDDFSLEWDY